MRNGKLHRPALSPRSRTLSGGARIADGVAPQRRGQWRARPGDAVVPEQQNTAPECVYGEYDGFYGDFAHTLPCRLVGPNAVRVVDLKLSKLRRA